MSDTVPSPSADPIIERLEDQIRWYDLKSGSNMHWYKRLKISEVASAAVIPFLAASTNIPHAVFITGILGVLVTVFEGMLQLNQYHENWIRYRSTCESLKHEKYIYLGNAGPYTNVEKPRSLLAERVEALVSQEHAKWATVQQQDPQGKPAA
jgi:hypothetical protein